MKYLSFALILLLLTITAKSQDFNIEVRAGYGFYNLDELKTFQTSLISNSQLPNVKAVETFPNNIYYSVSSNYFISKRSKLGLEFSFLTTGGRNHVADYSGEYKTDMHLNGYRIGPKYEFIVMENGQLAIGLQAAGGVMLSRFNVEEQLVVFDEELISETVKLKNTGFFAEPSVKAHYNLTEQINISLQGGYELNFKDELYLDGEETQVKADWSGIRFSVGISYCFGNVVNN